MDDVLLLKAGILLELELFKFLSECEPQPDPMSEPKLLGLFVFNCHRPDLLTAAIPELLVARFVVAIETDLVHFLR